MPKPCDHDDLAHPSHDTSTRFSLDRRLRQAGFRIRSRPRSGPVLWERLNERAQVQVYTQDEAARLA